MAAIHKYPIVIGCKRNLNGYSKDRKKRLDNSLLLYKLTNLKSATTFEMENSSRD